MTGELVQQPAPVAVKATQRQRLLYLIAAVAQGIGAIAVQPFAIRILDPVQWGQVSFMLALIAVCLVAITAGFPMSVGAYYFDPVRGRQKARALNGFGTLLSAAITTVAAAIFVGVTAAQGTFHEHTLPLVAIFIIGMHGIGQVTLAFLRSEQRALSYVIVLVLATVIGHGAGLFAISIIAPTAIAYLTAFAVCVLLSAALGLALTRPGKPFAETSALKGAIRMSLPVLPHSLALILMQQGEPLLINFFQGAALVGRYNAVLPFALGPIAVVLALGNVWQTILLSLRGHDPHGQGKRIQHEAYFVGFLLTLFGSGVSVFATYILVNDPEPELFAIAHIFPLIGFGYIIFLLASAQLFAIQRTRAMGLVTPTVALAGIAVTALPASQGDLLAVGLIKVVSYLILGLVYAFVVRRLGHNLIELRPLILWMAASIAVASALLLVPSTFGAGIVSAAVTTTGAAVAGVVYLRRTARSENLSSAVSKLDHDDATN